MTEYIGSFSKLVDSLAAYEIRPNPLYFSTRFVDGLHDDIEAAIIVLRPSDFNTAYVLAKLQEEVADRNKEFRKSDYIPSSQPYARGQMSLPKPPRGARTGPSTYAHDSRGMDVARSRPVDEKPITLKAYRHAKVLCEKCAE